jgi:hypothetical protein
LSKKLEKQKMITSLAFTFSLCSLNAPVAQPDRAPAFNAGAHAENRNSYGGGCCIGESLKKFSNFHDNTEETLERSLQISGVQSVMCITRKIKAI